MKISVEHIIQIVTREVIAELQRNGIEVIGTSNPELVTRNLHPATQGQSFEPDMSAYRTPVLTEVRLKRINPMVREIIIPAKTVLTPGARDYIRRNNLNIIYKS